ncbi:hypothetical Protein YC6258_00638 [Gynuella sunshinyii YC6258]|uniref:Uncharacterized protein n=1 Tax=Gynuella sunshinyii YC6258 TaxID=1445510 RepID=A0A0C5VH87_9GAMM|nr:hypothetical Protein YC6258_00638 [Gynuella sunshinyii YC6258]
MVWAMTASFRTFYFHTSGETAFPSLNRWVKDKSAESV